MSLMGLQSKAKLEERSFAAFVGALVGIVIAGTRRCNPRTVEASGDRTLEGEMDRREPHEASREASRKSSWRLSLTLLTPLPLPPQSSPRFRPLAASRRSSHSLPSHSRSHTPLPRPHRERGRHLGQAPLPARLLARGPAVDQRAPPRSSRERRRRGGSALLYAPWALTTPILGPSTPTFGSLIHTSLPLVHRRATRCFPSWVGAPRRGARR